MGYKKLLKKHIDSLSIINTHTHHLPDECFEEFSLTNLLMNSYVYWCGMTLEDNEESRKNFLEYVKYNSYFVYLQKAIQDLYQINWPITVGNFDEISEIIKQAHENKKWNTEILTQYCHYEKSILDAYWEPGSINHNEHIFSGTYRIDSFLFGYDPQQKDHNENSFNKMFGKRFATIDDYIAFMKETIISKLNNHSVALKSAIAYDRGLDFKLTTKKRASQVFTKDKDAITSEDIDAFQNYIFFTICKIASDLDVPFQIHTGLGKLEKSNPMQLQEVISLNPKTKFVLFHGGFPWIHEISGLLHLYVNVFADICWLPIISPSAAKSVLHEYIEVATSDKLSWGCDTLTGEESYGAYIAMKELVSDVLNKKINDSYMSYEDALLLIENMLVNNPKKLYKL